MVDKTKERLNNIFSRQQMSGTMGKPNRPRAGSTSSHKNKNRAGNMEDDLSDTESVGRRSLRDR